MTIYHPRLDNQGKKVVIGRPSAPTGPETWYDPIAAATWIPDSAVPESLNDIPVVPWVAPTTLEGWRGVAGQIDIDEPPLRAKGGKAPATGCIAIEPDGRMWIVSPTNAFGGYAATFPKGKTDPGLSPQVNAIKEVHEEAGLQVQLLRLIGDFARTTSVTRYYLARRVAGSPADCGWESQAVHLLPQAMLPRILTNPADAPVLKALAAALAKL